MGMINIKENTKLLLNELVYDFQKDSPELRVTQDYILYKALKKLKGDLQWTTKNTNNNMEHDHK